MMKKMNQEQLRAAILKFEMQKEEAEKVTKANNRELKNTNSDIDLDELKSRVFIGGCFIEMFDYEINVLSESIDSTESMMEYIEESYIGGLIDMEFDEYMLKMDELNYTLSIAKDQLITDIILIEKMDKEFIDLHNSLVFVLDLVDEGKIKEETPYYRYKKIMFELNKQHYNG